MRVLHAAFMQDPIPGIIRQMELENEASLEWGLGWHSRIFCPERGEGSVFTADADGNAANPLSLRLAYYRWLERRVSDYDLLLLRHIACDPFEARFIRRCPVPVFTVHHTMETLEVKPDGTIRGRVKSWVEGITGKGSIGASAGIVAVTPEIGAWEARRSGREMKPVVVYPNGAPGIAEIAADNRSGRVELLFVASGLDSPWHGMKRLIDAFRRDDSDCVIHIVGKASDKLVSILAEDPRFQYHGPQKAARIAELASRCTVGISGLAQDLRGLKQACTLKVREYLALGLPAYAAYEEVLPGDFPYYRNGNADLGEMLAFAGQMKSVSREEVAEASRPWIDKKMLLRKLYGELESLLLVGERAHG